MPMDADAEAMMTLLKQMAPLPTAETIAHEYRAARAADLAGREIEVIPVDHVETFEIPREDGAVTVRLYRHGGDAGPRPLIIYMHGGGFVTCSIETHDGYCRSLARETGLAVLSVDYRLAPEHPYPAAFQDCLVALNWAASDKAAAKGVDTDRLIVAGDSAGGALAAALCIWSRDHDGPRIMHQVLIYPVIENDFSTISYVENAFDYYLTTESMRWFWRQYIGDETAEADHFAAPGRAIDLSGLPAATVITAGYDPLRDEGAAYARRLGDAGVEVEYRDYPGTFHGFAGMFNLESARQSFAFIKERLAAALEPA